ncbi:MAG: hypothetical protein ACWGOX_15310, partial [Desulforhopalus sp.]
VKTLLLARNRSVLTRQLGDTTRRLEELETDFTALKTEHNRLRGFQHDLDKAELTVPRRQPEIRARERHGAGHPPEKYCYIRSLSEKGMDAREIASILAISRQEAEQLVTLTKIAREE